MGERYDVTYSNAVQWCFRITLRKGLIIIMIVNGDAYATPPFVNLGGYMCRICYTYTIIKTIE